MIILDITYAYIVHIGIFYIRGIISIKKWWYRIDNTVFPIKRTFDEIRASILLVLAPGQKTINQISVETGINWKTVGNHLVYLVGKSLVKEVFTSPYVRIFELTAFGKDYLRHNEKKVKISNNKLIHIGGDF